MTTYPRWNGATPLQWYRLMHQAEVIRAEYSLGLADVWGYINAGDYTKARALMDRVIADCDTGYWPRRSRRCRPTSEEEVHFLAWLEDHHPNWAPWKVLACR